MSQASLPNATVSIMGTISRLIVFDDAISYMAITVCESAWETVYDCSCEYRPRPVASYHSGLLTDLRMALRYCLAVREHHVAQAEFDKSEKPTSEQIGALASSMDKTRVSLEKFSSGASRMHYKPINGRAFTMRYERLDPYKTLDQLESTNSLSKNEVIE